MTRSTLALLLAALALPATAQTIYHCADANGGMLISNTRVDKSCKVVTSPPSSSSSLPSLGMSKTKVLSISGGPLRKTTSKKQGLVRELWFYGMGNALVFENGVLVEILSAE